MVLVESMALWDAWLNKIKSKEKLSAKIVQSLVYKNVHIKYHIYAGQKTS